MHGAPTLMTPLGPVSLSESPEGLTALHWRPGTTVSPLIAEALAQLAAYFAGRLTRFDLPIALRPGLTGAVQARMLAIPQGETRTYADIRLVYWAGGNPFHHHQDLARLTEIMAGSEAALRLLDQGAA